MAAYEVVLLWSGICGIVTCFVAWKLWRKKPERNESIQYSRQAVLEATNKRILEQNRELKDEKIDGPKSSVAEKEIESDGELGSMSLKNQKQHVKEQKKTEKTQTFQNKIIMTPIDQIKKSFHVKVFLKEAKKVAISSDYSIDLTASDNPFVGNMPRFFRTKLSILKITHSCVQEV